MTGPGIPENADAVTADWMRRALAAGGGPDAPLDDIVVSDVGAGVGLLAQTLRCRLTCRDNGAAAGPESVIVKLPSLEPKSLRMNRLQSLYKREFDYYRRVAADAPVRSPRLLYGDFEKRGQRFVLVLEDLAHMQPGDHHAGATPEQARRAVRALAKLHGRYWHVGRPPASSPVAGLFDTMNPRLLPLLQVLYLAMLGPALRRFGDCFSDEMRGLAEAYGPLVAAHIGEVAATAPRTFIHGDYRLDNLFFGAGDDVAVIDWQVCGLGCGLYDVAYFLGASVTTDVRRRIENDVLREYTDILLGTGVTGFTFDDCRRLYRSHMLGRLLISVFVCGGLDMTDERSRRLAESGLRRTLAAIEDLEAAEFLPARRPLLSRGGLFSAVSRGAYRVSCALRPRPTRRTAG